jgi:hypothetical protein
MKLLTARDKDVAGWNSRFSKLNQRRKFENKGTAAQMKAPAVKRPCWRPLRFSHHANTATSAREVYEGATGSVNTLFKATKGPLAEHNTRPWARCGLSAALCNCPLASEGPWPTFALKNPGGSHYSFRARLLGPDVLFRAHLRRTSSYSEKKDHPPERRKRHSHTRVTEPSTKAFRSSKDTFDNR